MKGLKRKQLEVDATLVGLENIDRLVVQRNCSCNGKKACTATRTETEAACTRHIKPDHSWKTSDRKHPWRNFKVPCAYSFVRATATALARHSALYSRSDQHTRKFRNHPSSSVVYLLTLLYQEARLKKASLLLA